MSAHLPLALLLITFGSVIDRPIHAQCASQRILAADMEKGDQFGFRADVDGDVMLLSSQFDDDAGIDSGSAYIFERHGGAWVQAAKLLSADGAADDRFGYSAALSRGRAVVGARYNDDLGYGTGSIYVFERGGNGWAQTAKLLASDVQPEHMFGTSVDIDGDTIVVGALRDDTLGLGSGAAYVFELHGGSWVETAKLVPSDGEADDRFGNAVAVSRGTIVVGAYGDDDFASQSGSVYVFEQQDGHWVETAKLLPSVGKDNAQFGRMLDADGDAIVVAALFDDGVAPNAGAAYVFERSGTVWTETARLTADNGATGDLFGGATCIKDDVVMVSASFAQSTDGAAYVFKRQGTGWSQLARIEPPVAQLQEKFGHSISFDGHTAVIGARAGKSAAGDSVGAAYVLPTVDTLFPYGTGCPGSGGFTPVLSAEGCSVPGGSVTMTLEQGLGGSAAFLLMSVAPAELNVGPPGCTLLVDPFRMSVATLLLSGTGPGAGTASIQLDIPDYAPKKTFSLQAWVLDPNAPGLGAAGSNGVRINLE